MLCTFFADHFRGPVRKEARLRAGPLPDRRASQGLAALLPASGFTISPQLNRPLYLLIVERDVASNLFSLSLSLSRLSLAHLSPSPEPALVATSGAPGPLSRSQSIQSSRNRAHPCAERDAFAPRSACVNLRTVGHRGVAWRTRQVLAALLPASTTFLRSTCWACGNRQRWCGGEPRLTELWSPNRQS